MRASHQRAVNRADRMVGAYKVAEKHWGSYDEVITDMIADLMHYVHELQVDREIEETVDDIVVSATHHYYAEIEDEE